MSVNVVKEKCSVCDKTAYFADKISVNDKIFHKACFRCEHCKNVLKLGSFASLDGRYFCKPHFKQLFGSNGNYNEGFGTSKHSAKWEVDSANMIGQNMSGKNFASSSSEKKPGSRRGSNDQKELAPLAENQPLGISEDIPEGLEDTVDCTTAATIEIAA